MGISRSSTIVIAYLMKTNLWTFLKAFDYCKNKRDIVRPNPNF